jgi:hypothetical protein
MPSLEILVGEGGGGDRSIDWNGDLLEKLTNR